MTEIRKSLLALAAVFSLLVAACGTSGPVALSTTSTSTQATTTTTTLPPTTTTTLPPTTTTVDPQLEAYMTLLIAPVMDWTVRDITTLPLGDREDIFAVRVREGIPYAYAQASDQMIIDLGYSGCTWLDETNGSVEKVFMQAIVGGFDQDEQDMLVLTVVFAGLLCPEYLNQIQRAASGG